MDFSKITRANFAFFQITTDGEIYGTDSWADPITLFGPYDWMAEEGFQYCSWDEPGVPPTCGYHTYQEGLIYLAHKAGAEVVRFMYCILLRCLNLEQISHENILYPLLSTHQSVAGHYLTPSLQWQRIQRRGKILQPIV